MEELNSRAGQHRISLVNREACAINGVSDVLSFDVGEVLLEKMCIRDRTDIVICSLSSFPRSR